MSPEAAIRPDSLPPATVEQPPSPALKQTPLHAAHVRLGGKMVGFGGWSMPVQYPSGILAEHRAVRTAAGVFDISHMGQFIVSGAGAKAWLNSLFTNNLNRIGAGVSQYGFLLNEQGGVIDDLIIYEYAEGEFLLVVNASKIDEDFAWLQAHLPPPDAEGDTGIELANRSDRFAALAVQGPRAPQIFAAFFGPDAPCPERFGVCVLERHGLTFLVARTGYTGEDGFEWFFPARASEVVWDELLATGAGAGLIPCGLGSRDSLRSGGLLSAQRLRPLAHPHPAGSRAGHLRGPGKTRLHRARRAHPAKGGRWPHRTARRFPHDGQIPATRAHIMRCTPRVRRSARRPAEVCPLAWKRGSGWPTCPRNLPRRAPRLKSISGANVTPPSSKRSRSTSAATSVSHLPATKTKTFFSSFASLPIFAPSR